MVREYSVGKALDVAGNEGFQHKAYIAPGTWVPSVCAFWHSARNLNSSKGRPRTDMCGGSTISTIVTDTFVKHLSGSCD